MNPGSKKFNARNQLKNGDQQIIVQFEGEPDMTEAFCSVIRSEHLPDAEISEIRFETYEGYVIAVTDYMHMIQIEQLSKDIPAIISIDKKQDQVLQKLDRMETSVTGEIHDLRTDLHSYLDHRLSIMEQDIRQIKTKIGLT
ncbi:MAG: hypothetical protein ABFC78_02500 [Methanoregula sp.]